MWVDIFVELTSSCTIQYILDILLNYISHIFDWFFGNVFINPKWISTRNCYQPLALRGHSNVSREKWTPLLSGCTNKIKHFNPDAFTNIYYSDKEFFGIIFSIYSYSPTLINNNYTLWINSFTVFGKLHLNCVKTNT